MQTPATVIVTTRDQDEQPTIVGSGKPATKRFDLADFTGIEITNTFHATITRADRFAVSVTADDNVLEHVLVDKDGPRLRVRLEGGRSYRLRPNTLELTVTLPVLEALNASGAGRALIEGFASDRPFHVDLNGASSLGGSIKAGDAEFELSGASTVKLRGSARVARLHASDASTLELTDLAISGEKLTVEADGASTVRLSGTARTAVLKASVHSRLRLADLALDAADVEISGDVERRDPGEGAPELRRELGVAPGISRGADDQEGREERGVLRLASVMSMLGPRGVGIAHQP